MERVRSTPDDYRARVEIVDLTTLDGHGPVWGVASDELNATLGVVLAHWPTAPACRSAQPWLHAIQSDLFILGTLLATPPSDPPA